MGRILSEADIAGFGRIGTTAPRRAFGPETAAAFRRQMTASLPPGALDGDPGARLSLHLLFTWALELVRHPRILDAVADLLGPNILCAGATTGPGSVWSSTRRRPAIASPAVESLLCRIDLGDGPAGLEAGMFVLAAPWAGLYAGPHDAPGLVVRYVTPHARPAIAVDTALLVRGIDQSGQFALAAEPVIDADPALLVAADHGHVDTRRQRGPD